MRLERRYLDKDKCQPIKEKRLSPRRGAPAPWVEKRDPNPYRCDFCKKDFTVRSEGDAVNVYASIKAVAAHLPCRGNQHLFAEGFGDFLERLRKRRGPATPEDYKLRDIMRASLSGEGCKEACRHEYFSPGDELPDDEKLRCYQIEWLACLLAVIRPGRIDPKRLTSFEWEQFSRIVSEYPLMGRARQRKTIRQFFCPEIELREIGIAKREPGRIPSGATRAAVEKLLALRRPLTREKRALFLDTEGQDYWKPSAFDIYREDPHAISRSISDWVRQGLVKRPPRT